MLTDKSRTRSWLLFSATMVSFIHAADHNSLPQRTQLGWLQQMRHPAMQMQNASPRPTVHALQLLQQVMQKGRKTAFGGERKCKNTLPLSSDAKCTISWSSQLLSFVPFPVHTRQSTFCLSKMHIPVGISLRYCWFFFKRTRSKAFLIVYVWHLKVLRC